MAQLAIPDDPEHASNRRISVIGLPARSSGSA
jgi:hypothetical protein